MIKKNQDLFVCSECICEFMKFAAPKVKELYLQWVSQHHKEGPDYVSIDD
jgi:hypothetical protein